MITFVNNQSKNVFLTKEYVKDIIKKTNIKCVYSLTNNVDENIVSNIEIVKYDESYNFDVLKIESNNYYINTGNYNNQIEIYEHFKLIYKTLNLFLEDINFYIPKITEIKHIDNLNINQDKSILIFNNNIPNIIFDLVSNFSEFHFFLTKKKPHIISSNITYVDNYNILDITYISSFCDIIISDTYNNFPAIILENINKMFININIKGFFNDKYNVKNYHEIKNLIM